MSVTEAKPKRGRQKAEVETGDDLPPVPYPAIPDSRNAWRPQPPKPLGPKCFRCNEPTDISSSLLKAYGFNVIRCLKCTWAGIENDTVHYDLATAASGSILRRAMILYELKYPTKVVPSVGTGSLSEILYSDDERWESETL